MKWINSICKKDQSTRTTFPILENGTCTLGSKFTSPGVIYVIAIKAVRIWSSQPVNIKGFWNKVMDSKKITKILEKH